jgi:hypothetical protein
MQYGSAPSPCGVYARGETEDYNVVILPLLLNKSISENNSKNSIQAIQASPNPASDLIVFDFVFDNDIKTLVEVYNTTGQKVIEKCITDNKFDISKLNEGYYFVRILQNESLFTSKFIIKR